jgi:hypothetical protein
MGVAGGCEARPAYVGRLDRVEPLANPARLATGVPVMRASRYILVGLAVLGLLARQSVGVLSQDPSDQLAQPPSEFSGRYHCPQVWTSGTVTNVVLGPLEDGNLVLSTVRGAWFQPTVDEMSDPRLEGTITISLSSDRYYYPDLDVEDAPTLMRWSVRIETDEGAWQGSAPDAHLPGGLTQGWGLFMLEGEGAYEGLTASVWTKLDEASCSCWSHGPRCMWDVRGLIFEGDMPPVPSRP